MLKLRPYQEEAVTRAVDSLSSTGRAFLVLPTGAGKTIIFCEIARRYLKPGQTVLSLAHRKELVNQAADKMATTPGKWLHLCKTVQSATYEDIKRASLIIVDECHHASAKVYTDLLKDATCPILGVTATPQRLDRKDVRDIFGPVVYSAGREELTKAGFLADSDVLTIPLKLESRDPRGVIDDLTTAQSIERNFDRLVAAIKPTINGRQTVVFTPTIALAQKLAKSLNGQWVAGSMPARSRNKALCDFSSGKTPLIACASLLTEGWDCPSADCAVMLKPTESEALYTQMIGRVLRTHEDKGRALIVDFLFSSITALDIEGWTPQEKATALGRIVSPVRDKQAASIESQEIAREIALYDAIATHEAEEYGLRPLSESVRKTLRLEEDLPTAPKEIADVTKRALINLGISREGIYTQQRAQDVVRLSFSLPGTAGKNITKKKVA